MAVFTRMCLPLAVVLFIAVLLLEMLLKRTRFGRTRSWGERRAARRCIACSA